ncbi:hypothetical protein [Clostridium perfringens]|uniref:BioF2-like acetyltransferase domain-containing protein n=1 Tax=Clostridium perfringens TaxID=1502 RepID=A0A133MSE4_CLOPF|nr:hypothetical protein [Clostridium perfringens]EGT3601054.1 hypothetical protein [Clostridium perfringens]KXA06957.1 hypothetical protein HMPREF3222_02811 [Clostridium perfringens]
MTLNRYIKYYEETKKKFVVEGGVLFRLYNKMIVPVGPITKNNNIDLDYKKIFKKVPGSILIRVGTGLDEKNNEEWYAVICDEFKSLEKVNSNLRYKIRKGLKSFEVRKIDVKELAEKGYDVFINAFKRYKNTKVPNISREEYYEDIMLNKGYEDIFEYWGVFKGEKLVAYTINNIYGKEEVEYSVIKIDPEYFKQYPSYALIYSMNKYYLEDRNFRLVNDGFRCLSHDTNIQQFLISNFNFRKQGVGLKIKYKSYIKIFIYITYPFRNILKKLDRRIGAIYKLEEIRKKTSGGK